MLVDGVEEIITVVSTIAARHCRSPIPDAIARKAAGACRRAPAFASAAVPPCRCAAPDAGRRSAPFLDSPELVCFGASP